MWRAAAGTAAAARSSRVLVGVPRQAQLPSAFGGCAQSCGVATLAGALHERAGGSGRGRLALAAPAQGVEWSYGDLSARVQNLASTLSATGYTAGDVVATDLASCAENLVLQLAASHMGLAVLSLKDSSGLEKFGGELRVRGAFATGADSFLKDAKLSLPLLLADTAMQSGGAGNADGAAPAVDESAALGYYSSTSPVTNAAALTAGSSAQAKLNIGEKDVVLVSITLNHVFGIGSAVSSALLSGAAVVLPDASGVVGCGSPSQRAAKTLEYLDALGCTLLFADTHTHKSLVAQDPVQLRSLRGGVCKVGSGTAFLEGTVDLFGVTLATMGKP